MLLHDFKTFQSDRMDVDDLIALAAFGALLRAEYEKHNLDEPEFVDVQLKTLRREIANRSAEKLEARRKEIKSRLEGLNTPAERKRELEAELRKLNQQEKGTAA